MNQNVLYHGTRYAAASILKTRALFRAAIGDRKVCLIRSANVAAYWALMERDDDEGQGSIFILHRDFLERRYKIISNPDCFWLSKTLIHDEAVARSQRHKELNRQHKEWISPAVLRARS